MNDNRSHDALSDAALEREIETALSVDPSPEFLVRVRTRVAAEPEPSTWRLSWAIAAAGAMAAVIVLIVAVTRGGQTTSPASADRSLAPEKPSADTSAGVVPPVDRREAPASIPSPLPALSASTVSAAPPAFSRTARSGLAVREKEPEVLVSPDEAAGLRRLIAIVRDGRVDLTSALVESTQAARALQPPNEIVVEPITVFAPITLEPIGLVAHDEEVRQ